MNTRCSNVCPGRWFVVGLMLAMVAPCLAGTASPLYGFNTKATVARYDNGLTRVAAAYAPVDPASGGSREVTDPVECMTDPAYCPTDPINCFITNQITCDTNIEWCNTDPVWCPTNFPGCVPTDPSWGCIPTDPAWGCTPTDPAWGCTPTDPAWGCVPTDPAWGCTPTDPAWGCVPTDPAWGCSPTDITLCQTDQNWCATDFNWCQTDQLWCPTDFNWCVTDQNWCATSPDWCATNPAICGNVGAEELPVGLRLHEAQPNPFNPFTTLSFDMPETGQARLAVYDLAGRMVRELVNGMVSRGSNQVIFDGATLPSGLYIYVLETSGHTLQNKMLLVK